MKQSRWGKISSSSSCPCSTQTVLSTDPIDAVCQAMTWIESGIAPIKHRIPKFMEPGKLCLKQISSRKYSCSRIFMPTQKRKVCSHMDAKTKATHTFADKSLSFSGKTFLILITTNVTLWCVRAGKGLLDYLSTESWTSTTATQSSIHFVVQRKTEFITLLRVTLKLVSITCLLSTNIFAGIAKQPVLIFRNWKFSRSFMWTSSWLK